MIKATLSHQADFLSFQPIESPVDISSISMQAPLKLTRTFLVDGIPRAMAGVKELWPGVGDAWIWFDDTILESHRFSFCRILKYEILPLSEDHGFRRLSAPVDVNNDKGIRFVEWLGFHREFDHPLQHYGLNGKGDYWPYVRFQ